MNIRSIGYGSVLNEGDSFECNLKNGEFLIFLSRTSMKLLIDEKEVYFPEGTLFLLDDKAGWKIFSDENPTVYDWICFDFDVDSEICESLECTGNQPVCLSDADFVSELIRNITVEFYSLSSRRSKMLDTLLKLVLLKTVPITRKFENDQQTAGPHYTSLIDLRAKIYRNPQLKWNIDTMAADVNMSRSYLQHIYREVFGVSCISDVICSKIEKAKEILSETTCTVSQVASMCGYDNEEHFMRQFKKIVGVTPTKFRKTS